MFHPLRTLDARTAAEDAAMRAAGFEVLRTGRWARTYRPDPQYAATRRAEAEAERIAAMGRAALDLHALAFPAQHADMLARNAATPAPVELDRVAAALAGRIAPDRLVYERLTVERRPS